MVDVPAEDMDDDGVVTVDAGGIDVRMVVLMTDVTNA